MPVDSDRPPLPHPPRRRRRRAATSVTARDGAPGRADGIEAGLRHPHIRHDHDVRIEEMADRVEAVNRRLREEGIAVEVLQGGEVAETAVEDLERGGAGRVALGGGRWILLEPAPGPLGDSLLRRVAHLAERGHRALVAHPERHLSADMFERMAALVVAGALVQATADFFLREEMAAGMLALAEAGLVHVLSSDAHTSHGGRRSQLSAAFERLGAVEPAPRTSSGCARRRRGRSSPATSLELPFGPCAGGQARCRVRAMGSVDEGAPLASLRGCRARAPRQRAAQLDPARQVLDHAARAAAEAVAEEVGGAGGGAGPQGLLPVPAGGHRGGQRAHHRVAAALPRAALEAGRDQLPGLAAAEDQRRLLGAGDDRGAGAGLEQALRRGAHRSAVSTGPST